MIKVLVIDAFGGEGDVECEGHKLHFSSCPMDGYDYTLFHINAGKKVVDSEMLRGDIQKSCAIGFSGGNGEGAQSNDLSCPVLWGVNAADDVVSLPWHEVPDNFKEENAEALAEILRGNCDIDATLLAVVLLCKGYLITHSTKVQESGDEALLARMGWRPDQHAGLKSIERKAVTTESKRYWAPARLDSSAIKKLKTDSEFMKSVKAQAVQELLVRINAGSSYPFKWEDTGATVTEAYKELSRVLKGY